MYHKKSRSRSGLSQAERIGIFYLIGFVLVFFLIKSQPWATQTDWAAPDPQRAEALRCQMQDLAYQDSLRRLPRIYPFNPNFLSEGRAYGFGMSIAQRARLTRFREEGNWIRSAGQFQVVTGVSDSVLDQMKPYFKFPDWTQKNFRENPKPRLSKTAKQDINTANKELLMSVYGIGETFADRILEHRDKQGAFVSNRQLYEVWGVRPAAIDSLLVYFEVLEPGPEPILNVLDATASDLATIPGVDFEMAKKMWEFVRLRGGLTDLQEFLKIEGMTPNKLRRIELYLKVEKR